jgi:hypothetical protein
MLSRAHRNDAAVAYSPVYCNNDSSQPGKRSRKYTKPRVCLVRFGGRFPRGALVPQAVMASD